LRSASKNKASWQVFFWQIRVLAVVACYFEKLFLGRDIYRLAAYFHEYARNLTYILAIVAISGVRNDN